MTTIEYDLDLTGGLMEEIHRLVAPPQIDDKSRRRLRVKERITYRRPGKIPNHDCCDSCKEGGDLLCCDKCPAAFHMQCHDPPLEEDDVPPGEWLCHYCLSKPAADDDDSGSTCSSKSRQSDVATVSLGKRLISSTGGATSAKRLQVDDGDYPELDFTDVTDEERANPLRMLARASKVLNPKQFELPKDVVCPISFPGSSKIGAVKRKPGRNESNKSFSVKGNLIELDKGLVPLPAKLCFVCDRSCRIASLLQCDYCPLVFHLDCLNPPLTALPYGRWMCPNHVEHVLDELLLRSVKVTERIRLWDQYTGPVDPHAVKIQFLDKVHRKSPMFRVKVQYSQRVETKVPQAIKAMYASVVNSTSNPSVPPASRLLSDDVTENLVQTRKPQRWAENGVVDGSSQSDALLSSRLVMGTMQETADEDVNSTAMETNNTDIGESDFQSTTSSTQVATFEDVGPNVNEPSKDDAIKGTEVEGDVGRLSNTSHQCERLNKVCATDETELKTDVVKIEDDKEFSVNSHVEATRSKTVDSNNISRVRGELLRHARALLCPVEAVHDAVPMIYRTLTVGTGASEDVCLTDAGHCNNASAKHACIFFDELSGEYELLNYSDYGTTVDDILYSCDLSVKSPSRPTPPASKLVTGVRQVIQTKSSKQNSVTSNVTESSSRQAGVRSKTEIDAADLNFKSFKPCGCKSNVSGVVKDNSNVAGWEGSAHLHHGSHIKIGCLEYVFSVTRQAVDNELLNSCMADRTV